MTTTEESEEEEEMAILTDGKTTIRPIMKEQRKQEQQQKRQFQLKNPILIAGFRSAGLVGTISANYIIEQLNMHQIAYVDSDSIMPSVIYIGGKLRHPFRLYGNDDGNICVLVCDVPMLSTGVHSVLNMVVTWTKKFSIREIIVLDGIPTITSTPSFPTPNTASSTTSGTDKQPTNIANSSEKGIEAQLEATLSDSKRRKPLIISNDGKTLADNGFMRYIINEDDKTIAKDSDDNDKNNTLNNATLIVGISGGLLAACLSNSIACTGLLIPTNSTNIPDPEGAAILIESLNNLKRNETLQIDTQQLKQKAEILKRKMQEIIKDIQRQQQQQQSMPLEDEVQHMYT